MSVGRVMTSTAAEEVRQLLDISGIRSTIADCPHGHGGLAGWPWRFQVMVFFEDLTPARRLLDRWTVPVHDSGLAPNRHSLTNAAVLGDRVEDVPMVTEYTDLGGHHE
ncbi:hypothetical protein ACFV98_17945 [Streptomyces violascens]|uniref:hypothetical protein n=1 Tax=Streptomyces violascens TaxID=67381 RepID=UPI003651F2C0